MSSRSWCSALVLAMTCSLASADDKVELPFGPRISATLSNGQQSLEAGLEHPFGGVPKVDDVTVLPTGADRPTVIRSGRMFATISLPFGSGTVVRIDKDTTDWMINLGVDFSFATRQLHDPDLSRSRYGLSVSAGHAEFAFFPNGGTTQSTEDHWSFATTAKAMWVHARLSELWAPQVAVTYERPYDASATVGIVSPGTGTMPPLVTRNVAIAAPGATPDLVIRGSCPYAIWPVSQFMIGPSLSHVFTGDDRSFSPFGGASGRFEGELWLYYFPKLAADTGATNVRIGLAPFASVRTYGDDGQDRFSYGALAELRINSEIFEY